MSSTYISWAHAKGRCTNLNDPRYADYGGRGIVICNEWLTFKGFLNDMGNKPYKMTLERVDNSKGYYKANCIWATVKDQANNRRSNVNLTHNGVTRTLQQWSEYLGLNNRTLATRLRRGWSIKRALTTRVT